MSEQTVAKPGCVIPRLQLAYLLQFAIWGSWSIALGGYMFGKMTGREIGYLFMAVPIGAIVAPMFIGPIADRFFSAQKMLGVLHLISGAALVACGVISSNAEAAAQGGQVAVSFLPIMVLMLISGLCYMPSIPLINAIVFKHVPESSKQPGIFIFGTIGWILVCLLIEVFAGGAAKPNFFFIGGGCGLALGLYAFTLPNTPPKGAPAPGRPWAGRAEDVWRSEVYHLRPLRLRGEHLREQLLLPRFGAVPLPERLAVTGGAGYPQPVL